MLVSLPGAVQMPAVEQLRGFNGCAPNRPLLPTVAAAAAACSSRAGSHITLACAIAAVDRVLLMYIYI